MKAPRFTIAILIAITGSSPLWAVELQPGTYTAQPPGTRILDLTYAHLERDALYSKGKKWFFAEVWGEVS